VSLIPVDPTYSSSGHRDQDKVGPIFKMKISKDTDSDRQALVAKQGSNEGSNEDESSYNYARDYLDDNDEETAGFGRHGL
jgi:hypothetical protein